MYRLAWPRVRALALRLLGDDVAAEDVAQQALISVFERASEYDPELGRALPWILGITGWTVKTHRRRHYRRREVEWVDDAATPGSEEALIQQDLMQAVHEVIGTLSPLDRETLLAQLEQTGAGPTYRKRLQRALERLRTRWWRTHGT